MSVFDPSPFQSGNPARPKHNQFLSSVSAAFIALEAMIGSGGGASANVATPATLTALEALSGVQASDAALVTADGSIWIAELASAQASGAVAADVAKGLFRPVSGSATLVWVRQWQGTVNPEWFGMVPNSSAAASGNVSAWNNMLEALRKVAVERENNRPGLARIEFPAAQFYFNDTLELDEGTMSLAGCAFEQGTVLRWTTSCTGLRVQYYDTAGAGGGSVGEHEISTHSIIERLNLHGPFYNSAGSLGVTEAEHHGVQLRATAYLRDMVINGFAGDGIYVHAGANATDFRGNANLFTLSNVHARYCRNGLTTIGADSGAYNVWGGSFDNNRRWGHYEPENATLGGQFYGTHFDANGDIDPSSGLPMTLVKRNGRWYSMVHGQDVWAKANPPTGQDSDNQGWLWLRTSGWAGAQEWVLNINVRSGGSVLANSINAQTSYHHCYSEGGGGAPQICSPNVAYGGNIGQTSNNIALGGLSLAFIQGTYKINRPTEVNNIFRVKNYATFGPSQSGDASDIGYIQLHSKGIDYSNVQWVRDGAVQATMQHFGPSILLDLTASNGAFVVRPGATEASRLDGDGLKLASGKTVQVNSQQVVGARQAAIANPTGGGTIDTENRATTVLILNALRAHGLIGS